MFANITGGRRFPRTLAIALLLIGVGAGLSARAADAAWQLVDVEGDRQMERPQRLAIAQDLAARLAVLQSVVPRQAESQQNKVRERLERMDDSDLGSTSRGRFFMSVAYQHYQLAELLSEAQNQIACILRAPSVAVEMHCWAQLASTYLSEERIELGLSTLRSHRMVPRDDDVPRVAQDPRVWYTEFGRGIVRGIVTPYLASQLGGSSP